MNVSIDKQNILIVWTKFKISLWLNYNEIKEGQKKICEGKGFSMICCSNNSKDLE